MQNHRLGQGASSPFHSTDLPKKSDPPPWMDQIGFIGHSQGNGTAFVSLSLGIRPDLGPKISCFIALAPAVFAGPLTHGFPFTALGKMEWSTWRRLFGASFITLFFPLSSLPTPLHLVVQSADRPGLDLAKKIPGVLDFIPIMTWAYDYAPQSVFVRPAPPSPPLRPAPDPLIYSTRPVHRRSSGTRCLPSCSTGRTPTGSLEGKGRCSASRLLQSRAYPSSPPLLPFLLLFFIFIFLLPPLLTFAG